MQGNTESATDVVVVGGGPVGLMLAAELRLGGVQVVVLERHPEVGRTHNANGLGGQVIELLRHRGLLGRFVAAATNAHPRAVYPFGGVHLDLTGMADPPLTGLQLEHPSVDRLLAERALELGAEIRHGRRVVGVEQDGDGVGALVDGPDGRERVTGRYLVGCDGARSHVRELAGIAFPGVTYPDVNRLGELTVPDGVRVRDDGGLDVPGVATVPAGFTRTDGGVFAMGSLRPGVLMVHTVEDEPPRRDEEPPMTVGELRDSIRRVLGIDLPLGEPRRLARYRHEARQAERYRRGRILLAGDAAHVLPATGIARSVGMLDAANLAWKLAGTVHGWAPDALLESYDEERRAAGARALLQTQAQVALRRGQDAAADALRSVVQELLADEGAARRLAALVSGADVRYPTAAPGGPGADADDPGPDRHPLAGAFVPDLPLRTASGATSVAALMHPARPVLLDLAGRDELRDAARGWAGRVDAHDARADDRPADALLIRPDGHVAWVAAVGEPAERAVLALRAALAAWFGPEADPEPDAAAPPS